MFKRIAQIASYNRDWHRFLLGRLQSPDEVLTFRLRNGQRLGLKKETRFLLNEIYLDRVYDLPGFDFETCGPVLDLGGNVGLFSMYVASRSSRAHVFSFEPSSANLELYLQNLTWNPGWAERITVFPMAVGASNGTADLCLAGTAAEYSTARHDASARSETVRCVDLATVFELCQVDEFDLAKIDIEGAETLVLDAAADKDIRRLKSIVIEWHHSTERLHELASRLRGLGFRADRVLLEGHMEFLHATRTD